MGEKLRFDMTLPNGEPLRFDMGPEYRLDGDVPASAYPQPQNPMSEDNRISAEISAANIATIIQKFGEIRALLPTLEQLDDDSLKRLLGIDQSTELDDIASEAITAHPEFKSAVVNATEYAKDSTLLTTTEPLESEAETTLRTIVLMRRFAAHDTRLATMAIYHSLAEFAARGNVAAIGYYHRMNVFFPGRPKKTPPATP
jgi:hypothetical protein